MFDREVVAFYQHEVIIFVYRARYLETTRDGKIAIKTALKFKISSA
jgi:hypothetical protein